MKVAMAGAWAPLRVYLCTCLSCIGLMSAFVHTNIRNQIFTAKAVDIIP